ncbi:MAG: cell division protein CrgA, partial [Cellulosimicrobium cellulans]
MPESKSRKKPKPQRPPSVPKPESGNPRWLVPTMLGLMLLGLAWIVLFYLSGPKQLPIPPLGA